MGAPENPRWEKQGSPKTTYRCQTEASDKVWDLNRKTERALDTLAILCERFEQVNSDVAKVDKEIDREFAQMQAEMERVREAQGLTEISAQAVHDGRLEYHRLASAFDEAEGALNEGLGGCAQVGCGNGHGNECDVDWNRRQERERDEVPAGCRVSAEQDDQ